LKKLIVVLKNSTKKMVNANSDFWTNASRQDFESSDEEGLELMQDSPLRTGEDIGLLLRELTMGEKAERPSFATESWVSGHMKKNLRGLCSDDYESQSEGEGDFVPLQDPKSPPISYITWGEDGEPVINHEAMNQPTPPPQPEPSPAMSMMELSDNDIFSDVEPLPTEETDLIAKMYQLLSEITAVNKSKFQGQYTTQLEALATRINEGDFASEQDFVQGVRLVFKELKGRLYVSSEGTNGTDIFQLMQFEYHLGRILPTETASKEVRWATIQSSRTNVDAPPAPPAVEVTPLAVEFPDPAPPVPEFFTFPTAADEAQAGFLQKQKDASRLEYLLERLERPAYSIFADSRIGQGNDLKAPLLAPLTVFPVKSSSEATCTVEPDEVTCLGAVLGALSSLF